MVRKNRPAHTVVDTIIPVYIPVDGGAGDLELGKAQVKGNTLIIEFNNKLPSAAIKHRIERGAIVGVTFVIPEDEAQEAREAEAAREATTTEEKDEADLKLLNDNSIFELSDEDLNKLKEDPGE